MQTQQKQSKRSSRRRVKSQNPQVKSPVGRDVTGFEVTKSIFPPMFKGQLTYSSSRAINNVLLAVSSYTFRANSLYDPDFTGVGTVVPGITTLSQLYDRYRVLGVRVSVVMRVESGIGGEVLLVASNQNSLPVAYADWSNQRFVKRISVGGVNGNNVAKAVVTFPIHEVYGVPKTQVRNEDDFASVMGNNPNNPVYFHVGWYSGAAAATTQVFVDLRFTYDCVFSLPLTVV